MAADEERRHVRVSHPTDGVALVAFGAVDGLTIWSRELEEELGAALSRLDSADDTRVIVVTGAGPSFSVGIDVNAAAQRRRRAPERIPWSNRFRPTMLNKPVVAVINGHAIGVGLAFAMHCDVRFVATSAKLAFGFTRRGMVPEIALSHLLVELVGRNRATDLLISGRTFTGAEAGAFGLATAVVDSDLMDTAVGWAGDVARMANPASVSATKYLLWKQSAVARNQIMRTEDLLIDRFRTQPDVAEGMSAFIEKRAPRWMSSHSDGHRQAQDAFTEAASSALLSLDDAWHGNPDT